MHLIHCSYWNSFVMISYLFLQQNNYQTFVDSCVLIYLVSSQPAKEKLDTELQKETPPPKKMV